MAGTAHVQPLTPFQRGRAGMFLALAIVNLGGACLLSCTYLVCTPNSSKIWTVGKDAEGTCYKQEDPSTSKTTTLKTPLGVIEKTTKVQPSILGVVGKQPEVTTTETPVSSESVTTESISVQPILAQAHGSALSEGLTSLLGWAVTGAKTVMCATTGWLCGS